MSKTVKAQLVDGRPIIFDFMVEDQIIAYEMMCPKCETKTFVISIDKSRIACTNPDCFAVICVRLGETVADMSKVKWNLN